MAESTDKAAEVDMAGRDDGPPGRRGQNLGRNRGPTRWSAGKGGPGGPWQWQWRRRHRRRRLTGCLLWLLTLLLVLLVLSVLFGGFRTGTRVGEGGVHVIRPALVQDGGR